MIRRRFCAATVCASRAVGEAPQFGIKSKGRGRGNPPQQPTLRTAQRQTVASGHAKPADVQPTDYVRSDFFHPRSQASAVVKSSACECESSGSRTPVVKSITRFLESTAQFLFVTGPTGSGKSSVVPLALLWCLQNCSEQHPVVWVSQPTRAACVSLAKYVASLLGCRVGAQVGYAVGDGNVLCTPGSQVVFCTPGFLARVLGGESKHALLPTRFDVLAVDEVHTGDSELQLLVAMVKLQTVAKLWPQSDSPRIVFMSATMPRPAFDTLAAFLSSEPSQSPEVRALALSPNAFSCEVLPLSDPPVDVRMAVPDDALRRLRMTSLPPPGSRAWCPPTLAKAIAHFTYSVVTAWSLPTTGLPMQDGESALVFLPGYRELQRVALFMASLSASAEWGSSRSDETERQHDDSVVLHTADGRRIEVFLLHGSAFDSSTMDWKLAQDLAPGARRVFLATDVMESSITIRNLRIVIDSGLCRRPVVESGHETLATCVASESSAMQRAGRCGRRSAGVCFSLHPSLQPAQSTAQAPWQGTVVPQALLLVHSQVATARATGVTAASLVSPDLNGLTHDQLNVMEEDLQHSGYLQSSVEDKVPITRMSPIGLLATSCGLESRAWAMFVALATILGVGPDAVLIVSLATSGLLEVGDAGRHFESLLNRDGLIRSCKEGTFSDVWVLRNIGVRLLQYTNGRDSSTGADDRSSFCKRNACDALRLPEFAVILQGLCQRLTRGLATQKIKSGVEASLRDLAALESAASVAGSKRRAEVASLFPDANAAVARSRLHAAFHAAFLHNVITGLPSDSFKKRVAAAPIVSLQREFAAPIRVSDGSESAYEFEDIRTVALRVTSSQVRRVLHACGQSAEVGERPNGTLYLRLPQEMVLDTVSSTPSKMLMLERTSELDRDAAPSFALVPSLVSALSIAADRQMFGAHVALAGPSAGQEGGVLAECSLGKFAGPSVIDWSLGSQMAHWYDESVFYRLHPGTSGVVPDMLQVTASQRRGHRWRTGIARDDPRECALGLLLAYSITNRGVSVLCGSQGDTICGLWSPQARLLVRLHGGPSFVKAVRVIAAGLRVKRVAALPVSRAAHHVCSDFKDEVNTDVGELRWIPLHCFLSMPDGRWVPPDSPEQADVVVLSQLHQLRRKRGLSSVRFDTLVDTVNAALDQLELPRLHHVAGAKGYEDNAAEPGDIIGRFLERSLGCIIAGTNSSRRVRLPDALPTEHILSAEQASQLASW